MRIKEKNCTWSCTYAKLCLSLFTQQWKGTPIIGDSCITFRLSNNGDPTDKRTIVHSEGGTHDFTLPDAKFG